MSTKTTFKRVALVAVAALGLGVLSVAPSSAAPIATTTVAYDTTTSTAIVGGQVTVQVTTDTSTDSTRATVASSGVGSVVSATSAAGADSSTVSGTPTSGTFYIDNTQPRYAKTNVVLTSAVVGSQVLTITPLTTNGTPGTAVTKTITWVAADTIGVSAAKSTSVINAYTANTGAAFTADAAITAAAGSVLAGTTNQQKAAIKVTLLDSNGVAVNGKALTASISGPGLLQIVDANETTTGTLARALTSAALSDNVGYVTVSNDGTAGVSTITISVGTTVIATETITFSGSAAKYEVTAVSGSYSIAANGSTDSATTGIAVKVTDSAGNLVDGHNVFLKSSDTTIATVSSSSSQSGASKAGYAYFVLTGVKSGSTTITAYDTSGGTSATISASTTVKVAKTEAATVTAAFDKASYAPGEKMTLNIVAKDADGNAVADANAGTYTMSANLGTTSTLPTAAAFVGGTHAVTIYAPVSSGEFTVSVKLLAGAAWATALDDTTITASANVVNPAFDAATDAANEATDAANAATDAALAAADAADAATAAAEDASAAVAKLAKSVNTALKALKKQITSLTALVNKLLQK
jgi:protocatechuate 3,4-dioxygenase beta subunit